LSSSNRNLFQWAWISSKWMSVLCFIFLAIVHVHFNMYVTITKQPRLDLFIQQLVTRFASTSIKCNVFCDICFQPTLTTTHFLWIIVPIKSCLYLSMLQLYHVVIWSLNFTYVTIISHKLFQPTVRRFIFVCRCISNIHDAVSLISYNFLLHMPQNSR